MTVRPTEAINRLSSRYYNEEPYSAENPGGLDESDDGLTAGHVTNFPAALVDVGEVVEYVGQVADLVESDAAAAVSAREAADTDAQLVHQDRLATDADAQATAADRQAVAQDRTAVEGSASAAATSATLSGQYAAAAGGSIPSVRLTWDTATADADPGNGKVRLNNATPSAATALYVDNLDAAGASITTVLDRWTASTNTTKGTLRIAHRTDATKWVEYLVTGTVVDGTGYRKITVTGGTGPGGFAAGDPVAVGFSRAGDAPTSFSAGTAAVPGWAVTGDSDTGLAQVGGANTLSLAGFGAEVLRAIGVAGATNFLSVTNSNGGAPALAAVGAATNIDIQYATKGGGGHYFAANGANQALIGGPIGANRMVALYGSNGGNPTVTVTAGGLDIKAADGSAVTVGGGQTGQFPTGLQVAESTHATSRRATLNVGSGWGLLSDISGAGVRDFGIWCGALSVAVFKAAANGVMTFGRAVFATPVQLGNVTGTITLDLSLGNRFDMTLIGNVILANPTNGNAGQTVVINAKQDGTGGRTISTGTYFKTKAAAGITLSTAANARDKIVLEQYSSTEIDAAIGKDWR